MIKIPCFYLERPDSHSILGRGADSRLELNERPDFLLIFDSSLSVANKTIPFIAIKALLINNSAMNTESGTAITEGVMNEGVASTNAPDFTLPTSSAPSKILKGNLLPKNPFLLQIKSSIPTVTLSFPSLSLRDAVKRILAPVIISENSFIKTVLDVNLDLKAFYNPVKRVIPLELFYTFMVNNPGRSVIGAGNARTNSSSTNSNDALNVGALSMYVHKHMNSSRNSKSLDICNGELMNQALIEVFLAMNCSFKQFSNLLFSSFFYKPENSKNSLDRLLSEKAREDAEGENVRDDSAKSTRDDSVGHDDGAKGVKGDIAGDQPPSDSIAMDYATRINTKSFLYLKNVNLDEIIRMDGAARNYKDPSTSNNRDAATATKPNSLEHAYHSHPSESESAVLEKKEKVVAVRQPLETLFALEPPLKIEQFTFEEQDLECARNLCKLALNCAIEPTVLKEKIERFSAEFKRNIETRYGRESLKFVERLDPLYYLSRLNED